MNLSDLKPAGTYANSYGVKSIIYGPPGSAKTPTINTAPNPFLLACEPGLLSMKGSTVPTYLADTAEKIEDAFKWLMASTETKKFDTICLDSVSQMCEIYLQSALGKKTQGGNQAHGLKAYGEMASRVMDHMRFLYYLREKHTYLICKEDKDNDNGLILRRPYFPGKQLNVEVPHLFDEVLHLSTQSVPTVGQVLAFRCRQALDITARDRSGKLDEFEQPNFGLLVKKVMG